MTRSSASSMPFDARIRDMSRPSRGTDDQLSHWIRMHASLLGLGSLAMVVVNEGYSTSKQLFCIQLVSRLGIESGIKFVGLNSS
jgi:hypothetical protein